MLDEIAPADARIALQNGDLAQFDYASPLGVCRVQAQRRDGVINLRFTPNFAPVTPLVPPPQSVTPMQSAPPLPVNAPYAPALPANDSGQKTAILPPELRGFNWGGLLLSWVWAIGNNAWLGLLGIIPIVGLIMRVVLGFKGNEMAWRGRKWESVEQFRATQKTWTIAGLAIVVGGNLLFLPITAAILFPIFARARENARRSSCQQNMKQISLGVMKYSQAHGDKFPPGTTMMSWKTALKPYVKDDKIYFCPSVTRGEESYLVNRKLVGKSINTVPNPAQTPLFYEAKVGHLDGKNVAFADGHIKWYRDEVFTAPILPQM